MHVLLARQLKRLGLLAAPKTEAEWEEFLGHVSRFYESADQDRYTLAVERDRLHGIIASMVA
jgi:hypothetical protein